MWWCQGKGPYLYLVKIELMALEKQLNKTLFVPPKKFQKLNQLWIFEYFEVKNIVWSSTRLNLNNFSADKNVAFLSSLPSLLFYSEWKFAAELKYIIKNYIHISLPVLPFLKKLVGADDGPFPWTLHIYFIRPSICLDVLTTNRI